MEFSASPTVLSLMNCYGNQLHAEKPALELVREIKRRVCLISEEWE